MNLLDVSAWSFGAIILLFIGASVAIATAGTYMAGVSDRLADLTGWGEAIFGAVLLGGSTSLAGIVATMVTASQNQPELAISNAVGNIAAQTTVLAIADTFYRRANLEHAAASIENLMQGALLIVMLGIPLLAYGGPEITVFAIHPLSLVLILTYIFGLSQVRRAQAEPLWEPAETEETRVDEPEGDQEDEGASLRLWGAFIGLALVVSVAGYGIAESAIALAERTGLSATVVGGLLMAIVTASPELVTSVAAVRRGALTLAVGGIIGGNTFDVMIIALADGAYREGSIYHAITNEQVFFIALTLILNGLLLLGLLRRERGGIGNIGFESALILLLYFGASILLVLAS